MISPLILNDNDLSYDRTIPNLIIMAPADYSLSGSPFSTHIAFQAASAGKMLALPDTTEPPILHLLDQFCFDRIVLDMEN